MAMKKVMFSGAERENDSPTAARHVIGRGQE